MQVRTCVAEADYTLGKARYGSARARASMNSLRVFSRHSQTLWAIPISRRARRSSHDAFLQGANDVVLLALAKNSGQRLLHQVLRQMFRELISFQHVAMGPRHGAEKLAELEGKAGIARLLDALSEPRPAQGCAGRIDVTRRGLQTIRLCSQPSTTKFNVAKPRIPALLKAFLAAGGNAKKSLAGDIVDRLEPEMAMTVRWLLSDIGPREVAAKLQPACGDVPASEEVLLKELDTQWRTEPDARHVVWTLLGGWNRLACIFYKTVNICRTIMTKPPQIAAIAGSASRLTRSVKKCRG